MPPHANEDMKFDDALDRAINVDEMEMQSYRESARRSKYDESRPVGQLNVNFNRTADPKKKISDNTVNDHNIYNKTVDVLKTVQNAVDTIVQLPLPTEGSEISR